MPKEGLDRLTEAQRDCLRMVQDQRQAKEIARALGISEPAVKQRLRTARQVLGVSSSVEAARILAKHEGTAVYPRGIYPSGYVDPSPDDGFIDPNEGRRQPTGMADETLTFGEVRTAYDVADTEPEFGFPLPFPTRGRPRNELIWWQLLGYGLAIAIGTAVLVSAGFNLLFAIKTVLEARPPG